MKRFCVAFVVFSLSAFLLVGCGTWVNPSNPNANYQADLYACQSEAARMYPVQMQTTTTPDTTSTNCTIYGSSASCTSSTNPGHTYNSGGDLNLGNRISAEFSCLAAKGWRIQSDSSSRSQTHASATYNTPSKEGQSCKTWKNCGFGEICVVQPNELTGICRTSGSAANHVTDTVSSHHQQAGYDPNGNWYCVKEGTSMGDSVPIDDDGRMSRVIFAAGRSVRCTDPENPILADVTKPSFNEGVCVNYEVHEGDVVLNANGQMVKVVKLYPSSVGCADYPNTPNFAQVVVLLN